LGQLLAIKYLSCYEMSQTASDIEGRGNLARLRQRESDARFWESTQIKEFREQRAEKMFGPKNLKVAR
jgi:hypothetical protein